MPDVIQRDRASLWHPYSAIDSAAATYEVLGADGVRLTLRGDDGNVHEVVDAMASWWCAIHGYRHPVLDAAVTEQVGRFSHVMFGGLTHTPAVDLAELLVSITPAGLDYVFFADSGSVSVEVALKLAVQYQTARGRTGRQRILSIRGGYHGDTFGAMSVCDPIDGMHAAFAGLLPSNVFAPRPPSAATASVADIERWIADVSTIATDHSDEIAAIIVEPVLQGAGGMVIYPPACLRALRDIADEHGFLLILDEIATGFGRTGTMFAAEHAQIGADIMCVGKALTGGYLTLAAMLCSGDVARTVSAHGPLLHGPTFMANPLACSVAWASIRLLIDADWQSDVARVNAALTIGLEPARAVVGVTDVRTIGAVGVVQLDRAVDVPAVTRAAIRRGAWVRPFRDLVYTMPPYISSTTDIDTITSAIVGAIAEVHGDQVTSP